MRPPTICLIIAALTLWAVLTLGEIHNQAQQASQNISQAEQQLKQFNYGPSLTPNASGEPQAWDGQPCTTWSGRIGTVRLDVSDSGAQCVALRPLNLLKPYAGS